MAHLNETGIQNLEAFLTSNMKPGTPINLDDWQRDIDFDGDTGHLEIRGRWTVTGNPATTTFGADEIDDADVLICKCCEFEYDHERELCDECEKCEDYCTCQPYDERAEHGTYH